MATKPLYQHKSADKPIVIGVDLMGSDCPPHTMLEALAPIQSSVRLLAIGLPEFEKDSPLPFQPAAQYVRMDENPLTALRRKKDSSLSVGLRLLKEGKIDALVSAGNTGAIVTGAKMALSMVPTIRRPALLASLPTKKGPVAVLDVGANVQIKAAHFVQFAKMAAAYLRTRGIEKPKIGILNIGSEPIKGTSELRLAYKALQSVEQAPFLFVGNVESTSVFNGEVDALVTDGFTGNIFLKTAEGTASLLLDCLNNEKSLEPQWKDLRRHLHYAEYPGALLIGVQGIVVKCHGYSTPLAIVNGVRGAVELARENFMQTFIHSLQQ